MPRARRPPIAAASSTKRRITIRLDEDVVAWFREQVGGGGVGYQTLINRALREYIAADREPLETTLRRVIREELDRTRPALMVAEEPAPYGAGQGRRSRRRRK
jgi:hypothetical protein